MFRRFRFSRISYYGLQPVAACFSVDFALLYIFLQFQSFLGVFDRFGRSSRVWTVSTVQNFFDGLLGKVPGIQIQERGFKDFSDFET